MNIVAFRAGSQGQEVAGQFIHQPKALRIKWPELASQSVKGSLTVTLNGGRVE